MLENVKFRFFAKSRYHQFTLPIQFPMTEPERLRVIEAVRGEYVKLGITEAETSRRKMHLPECGWGGYSVGCP